MPLSELDPEEQRIAKVIIAVLDHREQESSITKDIHIEQHRILGEWIARENHRAKRREKILNSVIGGILIATAVGIMSGLSTIGKLAIAGFQHTPHP